MQRLADGGKFPHEIGLFLGYPPEDVSGFIENRANAEVHSIRSNTATKINKKSVIYFWAY